MRDALAATTTTLRQSDALDDAMDRLDEESRGAVIAIAGSAQAVQPLQLHPGADKPAVLAAIAVTAHHNQARILALPATTAAADYAAANRYADTTATPAAGRDSLDSGRWKLPIGNLVIIDDADQLDADHLRYLTDNAERTNTKLLLLTSPQPGREPAHTLAAVLTTNLPWAHSSAHHDHRAASTAIERAEQHLAATSGTGPAYVEAAQLRRRRDALIQHYQYLATDATQSRTAGTVAAGATTASNSDSRAARPRARTGPRRRCPPGCRYPAQQRFQASAVHKIALIDHELVWLLDTHQSRPLRARQCRQCPFLGRCGYNAVLSRATHGVWGGKVLPGDKPAELERIYARLLEQFERRTPIELADAPVPQLPDVTARRRRRAAA